MKLPLNQGHVAALGILLIIFGWMALGLFKEPETTAEARALHVDNALFRVQVEHLTGQPMQPDWVFSAQTAAHRSVDIRTEIAGKIVAIHSQKGQSVHANERIMSLDKRSLPARVAQADANLQQRKIEAESTRQLAARNLANEAQVALAQTALANAQAELTHAQVQLAASEIRAPFAGIIDQQHVEVGDYVAELTVVSKVLDPQGWKVLAQVPEKKRAKLRLQQPAWALLPQGQRVTGRITFISTEADANTRTFAIEMQVDEGEFIGSGLTARLHIPQAETLAYFISPALLAINEHGELGLKGLDDHDRVHFFAVDILQANDKGIWVHGLPDNPRIITLGQGFVEYGETVSWVLKPSAAE